MNNMWSYWKQKYGNLVSVVDDHYQDAIKSDEMAYTAYQQAKVALYALEKRMDELAGEY